MTTPADQVRSQARAEMTRAILDAGRARLAADGPADLSLRAVARDVGMVSSAVYRYVPSREALLTLLIIESYDAVGLTAEQADASRDRDDLVGRWLALGRAMRTWALGHTHEWALIFGSPISGYAAPPDTIAAASRVPALLASILHDAQHAGVDLPAAEVAPAVRAGLRPVVEFFDAEIPTHAALRGLMGWTYLIGSVSMQVFGQRQGVVLDDGADSVFDAELLAMAAFVGVPTD